MTLPESKDFSYLFSDETNARKPSPLKTCIHLFQDPNIIFLGGGLPLKDYFPWDNLSVDSPKPPFPQGIGAPIDEQNCIKYTVNKDYADKSANPSNDIPLFKSFAIRVQCWST